MTVNNALWQDKVGHAGVIRAGSVPPNIADEKILVKVHAWGMNPADVIYQNMDLGSAKYPLILGEDIAGTIEATGATAASKFKVGDRICGLAVGGTAGLHERAGFQEYVVLDQTTACLIPDSLSFTDAVVLPLCIVTAAGGLFPKRFFGMPHPKFDSTSNGQTIFIGGGSSSVGCNAIQMSKAAGFKVVTSCSPGNFDLVKSLGADAVYDYNSATFIDDVVAELDATECFGIFQATGSPVPAFQVAAKSKQNVLVVATNPYQQDDVPKGVNAKILFASGDEEIKDPSDLFREALTVTFAGFLPDALARGLYKAAPPPEIVPTKGLEGIQEALDILKKGVSAKKLVVQV